MVRLSGLYNLNCLVVDPNVVKTVSKTTVSTENVKFDLENAIGFLQLLKNRLAASIIPKRIWRAYLTFFFDKINEKKIALFHPKSLGLFKKKYIHLHPKLITHEKRDSS